MKDYIQEFNKIEELLYQYKLEEAKKGLEEILKMEPDYSDANRKMAFIEYYYYKNYDEALKYIKKALEKQPMVLENHKVSGDIYFSSAQYENAIKDYINALSLDSNNTDIYYSLGQAYIKLDKREESKKILEKANGINPFDVKINTSLHLQYVKDGEYDKAYNVWKNGNVRDTESIGYFSNWNDLYKNTLENKTDHKHIELGNVYATLLLYDEAVIELERALKDDLGNNNIRHKIDEISLFIKFRDELKACWYSYYQRRIINGSNEESYLESKAVNIYKQMLALFPEIKDNDLSFNSEDFYSLNNEIEKKFSVIITRFPINGFLGCYFGYVVGDSYEEISHWGKKTNIRVTLAKNTVIGTFVDWYLNDNTLGGWSATVTGEDNVKRYENKIMIDTKYTMAYNHWIKATNEKSRNELLTKAFESDNDLFNKTSCEVFYSSLLKLQLEFKNMDELIDEAKTKSHTEKEIMLYVINYLVNDVFVPLTFLHEGQHAIDSEYYNYESWEREYRAMMSEPVYGHMQLLDLTVQLQQDIGNTSTPYGKAHTKIFTEIVNYINNHKEDYPSIDTNKNIMMQISKLNGNDLKEISKNIFEQQYPGQNYE